MRRVLDASKRRSVEWAARLRLTRPVAMVLSPPSLNRPTKSHSSVSQEIWVLQKTGLGEDIRSIAEASEDTRFSHRVLSREHVKAVARQFISCRSSYDYPASLASAPKSHEDLRRFWIAVLGNLEGGRRPSLLLGANWRFWAERDLALAAGIVGVPFVALHKECFKTAVQSQNARSVYRAAGRYGGARILTYNAAEKQLLVDAGVADERTVTVTGAPRFDTLHALRDKRPEFSETVRRPTIVCFAISPFAGLPLNRRLMVEDGTIGGVPESWLAMCEESLSIWQAAATLRPNVDFIVKVKVGSLNVQYIDAWRRTNRGPANLLFKIGGVADRVLAEATAACGFNTTAILDAIACGVPVAVLRYGAAASAPAESLHDYMGCVHRLSDLTNTLEWADDVCNRPNGENGILNPQATKLLEECVGNADGKAGMRVREELLKCINMAV